MNRGGTREVVSRIGYMTAGIAGNSGESDFFLALLFSPLRDRPLIILHEIAWKRRNPPSTRSLAFRNAFVISITGTCQVHTHTRTMRRFALFPKVF